MVPGDLPPQRLLLKIVTDIVCLIIIGGPVVLIYFFGFPYSRGFFCDDESLKHPYRDSSVPSWALYIFGLGIPIVTVIGIEIGLYNFTGKKKIVMFNKEVPAWVWQCYRHISVFGFGAVGSQLITDIGKYAVGRLRPHFFSVCQPDIDCANPKYKDLYIERFSCKGSDMYLMKDMRLSFPSGHASFSTYCMVFVAAYIQSKIHWRIFRLLKHTLQLIAFTLAVYTSLSRISDYKHHWSDVLAGAVQGAVVAILIVVYASDLMPLRDTDKHYVMETSPNDNDMGMGDRRAVEFVDNRIL